MRCFPARTPAWTDDALPLACGRSLRLRVLGEAKAGAPTVLHLQGGAFRDGTSGSGGAVAAALHGAGATVLSPDYPAGPAHPFPEALELLFQALCAVQARRRALYVAGEEAGGNLAAALALVARDRQEPRLAGQILLSPMLDPRLATCSFRTAEAGAPGCKWAEGWHEYLGTPERACHPYAAPGGALRLAGVAPALVLAGAQDPMRDEAEAYAARLRAGGVTVWGGAIQAPADWPDAWAAPAEPAPAWAAELRAAVTDFLAATARPRPSSR